MWWNFVVCSLSELCDDLKVVKCETKCNINIITMKSILQVTLIYNIIFTSVERKY